MHKLKDFLTGENRLLIVFWVFLFLIGVVFMLTQVIMFLLRLSGMGGNLPLILSNIFFFIYFPLVLVATWNSASNYTKRKLWCYLAKIIVILTTIYIIFAAVIGIINLFSAQPIYVKSAMIRQVAVMNEQLPAKINDDLELMEVSYDAGVFTQHNRFINPNIDIDEYIEQLSPLLLEQACSGAYQPIIANRISVAYHYEIGDEMREVLILPEDCN